jgi:S-adenosylmethionine synthetase
MTTHSQRFHVAEDILPGHPDRVADAIAEGIVDHAVGLDPDALVGVEVALFRDTVVITGRIAAGRDPKPGELFKESIVYDAVAAAGYHGRWSILPVGAEPREDGTSQLRILHDLELGPLSDAERGIRRFSDDQNIVVGHAWGYGQNGWLPPAVFVARRLREALIELREKHSDRLGPDGKVLVRLDESGESFGWDVCNVAIQHAEGVGYDELHALVVPALAAAADGMEKLLQCIGRNFDPARVRVNGGGDFSCGGTHGDNGLSGKKLVVDGYGPGVPIGGGALCGKDPHKVDRAGALRARQLARRLVNGLHGEEATVRLGFLPGLESPAFLDALVDGESWDHERIADAITIPDLSLEGTFEQLELAEVSWTDTLRAGYFGSGRSWER